MHKCKHFLVTHWGAGEATPCHLPWTLPFSESLARFWCTARPVSARRAWFARLPVPPRAGCCHVLFGQCLRFGANVTSYVSFTQALTHWLQTTTSENRDRLAPRGHLADLVRPIEGLPTYPSNPVPRLGSLPQHSSVPPCARAAGGEETRSCPVDFAVVATSRECR